MEAKPSREYYALQAEWLRYKSRLYDKATGLPTLGAVIEEVRKLSEESPEVGVILLAVDRSLHLEEIHGWQYYDAFLASAVERLEGSRGRIIAPQDIIAVNGIRGDQIWLFVKCRTEPYRHLESLQTKLMALLSEVGTVGSKEEGAGRVFLSGASMLERDARIRFERLLYQAIERASHSAYQRLESHRDRLLRMLRHLLDSQGLVTLFQPIFDLNIGQIFGYEALTRGPQGTEFESAEALFSFAEQTDLIIDLERMCRRRALQMVRSRNHVPRIFINCSVRCLEDIEFEPAVFRKEVAGAGLANDQVVFEITERVAIPDWKRFQWFLSEVKEQGFLVAIDDMGAGYSNLKILTEIEPDFLKLDISLVQGADTNLLKLELLKTLKDLAGKIGAEVIAEGLETQAEHQLVRELGIPYGQGFYLARPEVCGGPKPFA